MWFLLLQVVESRVIIHSVGISDGSESKVDRLAVLTGGFKAQYSEDGKSNALNEAFAALANMGITGKEHNHKEMYNHF